MTMPMPVTPPPTPTGPVLPLTAVRQVSLPAQARETSTLARIDYSDAFLVDVGIELEPERWARAMLAEAPGEMRWRLVSGWMSLGLRLGSPGPPIEFSAGRWPSAGRSSCFSRPIRGWG